MTPNVIKDLTSISYQIRKLLLFRFNSLSCVTLFDIYIFIWCLDHQTCYKKNYMSDVCFDKICLTACLLNHGSYYSCRAINSTTAKLIQSVHFSWFGVGYFISTKQNNLFFTYFSKKTGLKTSRLPKLDTMTKAIGHICVSFFSLSNAFRIEKYVSNERHSWLCMVYSKGSDRIYIRGGAGDF